MRLSTLVLLTGCTLGDTGKESGEDLGYDLMHTECGPDDGPVPELKIGLEGSDCDATTPADAAWLRARFSSEPAVGVAYPPNEGELSVWIYPSGGETDWENPSGGSLTLDAYAEGASASGSYDFTLEDGSTLAGSFDAVFCELDYGPCG